MAEPHHSSAHTSSVEVVQFFRDKQKRDPGFFPWLANKLWDDASADVRYGIITVQTSLHATESKPQENIAKLALLAQFLSRPDAREYMEQEQNEIQQLEVLLNPVSVDETSRSAGDAA